MRRRHGSYGPCKGGCGEYALQRLSTAEVIETLRRAQVDETDRDGGGPWRALGRVAWLTQSLAGLCDACEKRARRCAIVRALPVPALPSEAA